MPRPTSPGKPARYKPERHSIVIPLPFNLVGVGQVEREAIVYGDIAVHPVVWHPVPGRYRYSVTHVPTGTKLWDFTIQRQAKAFALRIKDLSFPAVGPDVDLEAWRPVADQLVEYIIHADTNAAQAQQDPDDAGPETAPVPPDQ